MKVTRIDVGRRPAATHGGDDDDADRPGQESPGPPEQPRPADRSARLRSRARSRATTPAIRRAVKSVSTISRSSTRYIHPLSNGGRIIAGQFDDPYQLDEKGIFDLVNLATTISAASPARAARRPRTCSPASTSSRSPSRSRSTDIFPDGIPHNGALKPNSTDSLLRVWSSISRQQTQTVDAEQHHHRPQGRRATGCRSVAMRCRSSTPASSARSVRRSTCAPARCTT